MYCTHCGLQLQETNRFCPQCGQATPFAAESAGFYKREPRLLRRSLRDKKIGGVCAGLAEYLDVDVVLTRVLVVAAMIVSGGLGLLVYIAAWIIIPLESREVVFQPSGSVAAGR